MLANFELKRLKPKLDIVKNPENRVHELTDSNVSPAIRRALVVGSRVRVLLDLRAPMQRSASLGDMEQFFGEADLAHAARV